MTDNSISQTDYIQVVILSNHDRSKKGSQEEVVIERQRQTKRLTLGWHPPTTVGRCTIVVFIFVVFSKIFNFSNFMSYTTLSAPALTSIG